MVARPEVGSARPSSSRMVVDFPAPFGPRNPVMRPGASSKDRSLTAVTVPYRLASASTAMVLMAVPPEEVVMVDAFDVTERGRARRRPRGRTIAYCCGVPDTPRDVRRPSIRSAAGGDQPGLVRGDDELGPVPHAELGQDPADVRLCGRPAHHQPAGE